jgi:Ser/Thr protein kinase RdoA (MazF antagonist)
MIGVDAVADVLAQEWGLPDVRITPHNGGMNSLTWWIDAPDRRWVAKSVPASAGVDFLGGLAVAARVQAAGIPSGAAVPTRAGALTASVADPATASRRPLALLNYVPGDELSDSDPDHVRLVGTTLGRVHVALREARVDGIRRLRGIDLDAGYMGLRDWIRPAVTAVLDEYAELDPDSLTSGLLHSDPAPEAFRIDRSTGIVGLIDWGAALSGPLLYDVASAAMYVGGVDRADTLLDAYLATGALPSAEVERGVSTMLRFRWAIQAMYFAWRTASDDLTGIDDGAGNEEGLADAKRMLT